MPVPTQVEDLVVELAASGHRAVPVPAPNHAALPVDPARSVSMADPPRPLRLLVVTPKGFLGGAERWLLGLLDATDRLEPTVVVLDAGPLAEELQSRGIRVVTRPTGAGGTDLLRAGRWLRRVVRDVDPDVVLGNGVKSAAVALVAAKGAGAPVVWVKHEPRWERTLGRVVARGVAAVVAVSPAEAEGVRHARIAVLPPPLLNRPLDRAAARSKLSELGVPTDGLLLGAVARLARYKGIDTAIEALARPEAAGWRLVVAGTTDPGDPGEGDRLRALADRLGVAERVTWLGEVPAAGALLAGTDAVAVLTRSGEPGFPDREGFGMVVVEAAAAGVPVLADPVAVPSVAAVREAGVVAVPARDPSAVAAALGRLADPGVRSRLGASGRAAAAEWPTPARAADALVALLASVAQRPGAGLTTGPAVSVVTTVRDESAEIDALVSRLLAQLAPAVAAAGPGPGRAAGSGSRAAGDELVVVDGGSRDDTVARLRAWQARDSRLRVVLAPGAGISAGRNAGIRAARNGWVACTDAGCTQAGGWLDALRAGAAETGNADLVTGVYRVGSAEGHDWQRAMVAVGYPDPAEARRPTPLVRIYGRLFGRTFDPALPTGRSVAFTVAAWRDAGGYPENLPTAEDVAFGQAVVAAGHAAQLCLDAEVRWEQRPTLAATARMYRSYGRGGGQSGSPLLVARDLVRAAAYLLVPVLAFAAGTAGVALVCAGAAAYLSLPLRRAVRSERPLAAVAILPLAAAIRDVSKAVGCVEGLLTRRAPRRLADGSAR